MNFTVQEKKQYFVSWGRKITKVFENPIKYLRKPYYLNIKFHPDFYITEVSTNHPELQKFKMENIFPKTLYRIIDFNKHPSLLNLIYRLKLQAPKKPHNIHLQLNSSKILTRGKLKTLTLKNKYSLKLEVRTIDNTEHILDQYQNVPKHIKQIGYQLYDDIYAASFNKPLQISTILKEYPHSRSTLYRHFKNVIGVPPSMVLKNRKLLKYTQHLLNTDDSVTDSYSIFGFSSNNHLHRDFNRVFDTSPIIFRKNYRKL